MFQHFMKKPAKAGLTHRVSVPEKRNLDQERKLTTCCHVFIYLLQTYATDDFIAKTEADITHSTQSVNMSANEFVKAL